MIEITDFVSDGLLFAFSRLLDKVNAIHTYCLTMDSEKEPKYFFYD